VARKRFHDLTLVHDVAGSMIEAMGERVDMRERAKGNGMAEARQYRQYAEECRRIARTLPPDQRERLMEVADAWDACARTAESKENGGGR
jgi:hypothetical protein